ncbi:MAG: glycosyltransferase family 2 protein [Bacteroidia bacterium]
MPPIRLPQWLFIHQFPGSRPEEIDELTLGRIQRGLDRFKANEPLVSIVMPVYNEEENLIYTLSSFAELTIANHFPCELIIVNDGSLDETNQILDFFDITHIQFAENRGIKDARQAGLELAKGQFILQADADSIYPPGWGIPYIEALKHDSVVLAYGKHAFIPSGSRPRWKYLLHETFRSWLYNLRRINREYINVHGFNSAFLREEALKYGSYDHTENGSEDGHMAMTLMKIGRLQYVSHPDALVWTSDRRIMADGGLRKGFLKRLRRESRRLWEYLAVQEVPKD